MPDPSGYAERLEHRARELGLPTEPEAYQDGGLVAVTTTYTPAEAELLAAVIKGAGVPAWVQDANTAPTLWHISPGMFPDGIAVLVPAGRLEDARAALAESTSAGSELAEEHAPAEALDEAELEPRSEGDATDVADRALLRRARGAATALAFLGIVAPLLIRPTFRLLRDVLARRRAEPESPTVRKAFQWAVADLVLLVVGLAIFALFVTLVVVGFAGSIWQDLAATVRGA
jgi:hypothetical protein